MRSSKPPALATWVLEHLTLGDRKEALTGDLLEEFHRRRSVVWYWRQVLAAILMSFSSELRGQWVAVSAQLAFAAVWTYALTAFVLRWIRASLLTSDLSYPYAYVMTVRPYAYVFWSLVLILLSLVVPLSICLAMTVNLHFRAFTRSLFVGLLAMLALRAWRIWPEPALANFLIAHGLATGWAQSIEKWYGVLIGSVPLLLAMWVSQLRRKSWRRTTIPPSF
jgi:hypothetical protein